jgi:CheY-like chemotaxis protein
MNPVNTIVVIDDDEDDHYLLTRIFERIGVSKQVVFFSQGDKALTYLKNPAAEPFIILCDVNMPLMTGLEFRRRMMQDESMLKKNTPFIFFSTAAMISMVKEAYDLRVQGFFIKEQSLEKMESTLKVIFDYWEKCEHPNGQSPTSSMEDFRNRERPA